MGNTIRKLKRTAAISLLLCSIGSYVHAESKKEPAKAETPLKEASKKPAKELQPWEAWDKYRPQMLTISRQLGVTCTHCHDSRNYRDASKKTHEIAKSHMELVDMINAKYKNSFSEKVDCYMCHKGVARPEFIEKKEKF
jgi:hypothetical protein